MRQKKNFFSTILSYMTYQEKKQPKAFYIPEYDEQENKEGKEKDSPAKDSGNKGGQGKTRGIIKPTPVPEAAGKERENQADDKAISKDINQNLNYLKAKFNAPDNKDIVIREFLIAEKYSAFIVYLEGMVDRITINNFILRPLLKTGKINEENKECKLDFILKNIIETNQTKEITSHDEAVYDILSGNTLLYVDGCSFYISNETKGYDKRGVEKPQTEGVVIGPQEAFNETLRTNITLLRKIIKNNNLTTEFIKVGEKNQNLCAVMYIKGLTNPAIIDEVKRRIKGIKADFIMGEGFIAQFIDDNPFSLLPSYLNTERPDKTAAHILEGKVAVLSEGTPFSIIVPVTAQELVQSPEDSFMRWQYGSFIRIIRLISLIFAMMLPGLYVAVTTFHQEMIPTDLLIAIAKAKEQVPFPTLVEVILMEISFELIREAGIRIPGIIGNTLGIIGALILGQAAVQANIVSPILIIVVAITGLGNFAIPNFSVAFGVRIVRFVFIAGGAFMGFYGISIAFIITLGLFTNLKSFGVRMFSPISPKTRKSKDYIFRWPIWKQEFRPDYVNPLDLRRQADTSRQWAKEDPNYTYEREEKDD